MNNNIIAIAYIPVLHKGYFDLLKQVTADGVETVYLIGDDILAKHEELDYINRKDRIRALNVEEIKKAIQALFDISVKILSEDDAKKILKEKHIIMPDEDISRFLASTYFDKNPISYVNIFLRWHRDNTRDKKVLENVKTISTDAFDKEIMLQAIEESGRSADWWRQIASVITKEGEPILIAHNKHMPDEQSPNIFGDPRAIVKRGVNINVSTAAHSEGIVISEAARKGISLEGASIYVTEFPCPYCARLIAHSGIKKCYFSKGYAVLDGEEILTNAEVELILVDIKE